MVDTRSAKQPLDEVHASVGRLLSYETPAELADAVAAVWATMERSLRLLVRADPEAPDELRLNAFAREALPLDTIITHLRRRDLVSLELAGMLHELEQVAERVAGGSVRAADGDVAKRAFERLRAELSAASEPGAGRLAGAGAGGDAAAGAHAGGGESGSSGVEPRARGSAASPDAHVHGAAAGSDPYTPTPEDRRRTRRLMLFAAFIFFVGGIATLISVIRGPGALEEEAVAAFREERFGVAERGFRILLDRQPDHVTAMLYLGRIYRRQGRMNEASEMLQAAAAREPADADVRRELGYLFQDLHSPARAAEQFRRAVELDETTAANWIGLIQALRAAGDPAADEWLARAPANVRAALTPAAPQQPFPGN